MWNLGPIGAFFIFLVVTLAGMLCSPKNRNSQATHCFQFIKKTFRSPVFDFALLNIASAANASMAAGEFENFCHKFIPKRMQPTLSRRTILKNVLDTKKHENCPVRDTYFNIKITVSVTHSVCPNIPIVFLGTPKNKNCPISPTFARIFLLDRRSTRRIRL